MLTTAEAQEIAARYTRALFVLDADCLQVAAPIQSGHVEFLRTLCFDIRNLQAENAEMKKALYELADELAEKLAKGTNLEQAVIRAGLLLSCGLHPE